MSAGNRNKSNGLWARFDVHLHQNPKILAVPVAARWLFVASVTWSKASRTDGKVPEPAARALARQQDVRPEMITQLVQHGLWERGCGGFLIHDYGDWQQSTAEQEALRKKRAMAGELGARARWTEGSE